MLFGVYFLTYEGRPTEMKKNVLRVLAMALVAAMLFACASCTQTILVRFVDKDGNDIDLSAISVAGGGSAAPAAVPTADTTAAPAPEPTSAAENAKPYELYILGAEEEGERAKGGTGAAGHGT